METEIDILLVEDNSSDAEMAIRVLKKNERTGRLLHLRDGVEALDYFFGDGALFTRTRKPKVILLDLKMPRVDGIEVLRQIKADEVLSKIPVVVLTSSGEDRDIQRCYELGVNSYIVKPVEFESYVRTITALSVYWTELNQA